MHVEKINTPIFMLHGLLGAYSLYQGKELKYALSLRNIPVSFYKFELEGHTFDRLSLSRKVGTELTLNWLKKFLNSSFHDEEQTSVQENDKLVQGERR